MGALDPAGQEAQRTADLFWWMAGGALIWVAVVAVAIYATYFRHPPIDRDRSRRLVVVGGVVVPIVALTVLLVYGLAMIPPLLAPTPEGTLRIHVTGEQWWWRVRYDRHGEPIELANEIRLPVGRPAELQLDTRDVIHSLWIPAGNGALLALGYRTAFALTRREASVPRGALLGLAHGLVAAAAADLLSPLHPRPRRAGLVSHEGPRPPMRDLGVLVAVHVLYGAVIGAFARGRR